MINIRLGNYHKQEKYSMQLIESMKKFPGCADAVWFASEYGFPPLEAHRAAADQIVYLAQFYRDAGLRVDLQISNTVGHGQYMKQKDCSAKDIYNFERIVDADGVVGEYAYCWNGENFRKYCYDYIKMYCEIKPDTVWVDDDLRAVGHSPAKFCCFCDDCMKRFNMEYDSSFTREELVKEINYGDLSWREKFIEFTNKNLADFAGFITDAVMEISPDTVMGMQYCIVDNYSNGTYKHIFDAMYKHSGKPPVSRPGGGVYDDKIPYYLLGKQILMSYANYALPEYIEYNVPEIENTPDVPFGKTIHGTLLESTMAMAYGFTGLSYATMMRNYENIHFFDRMFSGYAKHRAYWQEMAEINKTTHSGGIAVARSGRKMPALNEPFDYIKIQSRFGTELTKIGLAESHDVKNAQVLVLNLKILKSLTDDEIKALFDRPVITDATVIEEIINRGLMPLSDISVERSSDDNVCEKFGDKVWCVSAFGTEPLPPYIIKGDVKPISELYSNVGNKHYGTTNAIISFKNAKWAVFGYALWHDTVSTDKRDQIFNAIDEICGNKLPARLKNGEQVTLVPRIDENGKTAAVTLLNISIADTEDLVLTVRNPRGDKLIYKNADFSVEVKPKLCDGGCCVTLPRFTRGWDAATLFIY